MIKDAKSRCDFLVVGINSDAWLERKKGRSFMPWKERERIVRELRDVNLTMHFTDEDGSAFGLIYRVSKMWPDARIIFMNGGDRTQSNIPETEKCSYLDLPVEFQFGVGGNNKANSSSWILEEWKTPKVDRVWGSYRVIDEGTNWRVKELTIEPSKALSDQRHSHRSEHWHVVQGNIGVKLESPTGERTISNIGPKESLDIPKGYWHKPYCVGLEPAKIVEIWFGDHLDESDIERRD
ncbi:MAG: hypothetical protein JAZ07_01280 [Candidatus Thiodiazotropha endolucinida]|uniref:Mannose-6-phosphate isomerase type II C-terminal domain-containing protein n=1 Tax=Candidatus Thiodiazotropha taylori TaxID=2792791 RepID=A0A9E4KAA6_9GAMM|nr:hypothetical protein [Candidatus Thiodiazotropha taylori]